MISDTCCVYKATHYVIVDDVGDDRCSVQPSSIHQLTEMVQEQ